jgi:F420-non-reducing hydrogenase iron-sulfur subunit
MVLKMKDDRESNGSIAVFFCRQIDPEQDRNRRSVEKEQGSRIRFYPLPCSGRVEALHFLKALEAGARKVYLVMCPSGACRYGQGNIRARKRFDYAKGLIREVGYPEECLEIISAPGPLPLSIERIVRPLLSRSQEDGVIA